MNRTGLFLYLLPLCFLLGCGPEHFPTAPASGEVSYDGKRLTGGSITLIPINEDGSNRNGKAAVGQVGKDGLFVLTTYEEGDGAILGKHRVVYTPPEGNEEDEGEGEIATNAEGEEVATPTTEEVGIEYELEVHEDYRVVEVNENGNLFSIILEKSKEDEDQEGE